MAFSAHTLDFLFINKLNDSREWFNERRDEYEEFVLNPMRQLVTDLRPAIMEIDPLLICEPKVNKSISRVFRDTRFSKDKSIFRDTFWCTFMRDKKLYHGMPGFFFELSPRNFRYGCGYYQVRPEVTHTVRQMILAGNADFKKAKKCVENSKKFTIMSDYIKRSKYPDQPEDVRLWLDMKNYGVIHESTDFELLFSENLAGVLAGEFKSLKPLYDFLIKAENMTKN